MRKTAALVGAAGLLALGLTAPAAEAALPDGYPATIFCTGTFYHVDKFNPTQFQAVRSGNTTFVPLSLGAIHYVVTRNSPPRDVLFETFFPKVDTKRFADGKVTGTICTFRTIEVVDDPQFGPNVEIEINGDAVMQIQQPKK